MITDTIRSLTVLCNVIRKIRPIMLRFILVKLFSGHKKNVCDANSNTAIKRVERLIQRKIDLRKNYNNTPSQLTRDVVPGNYLSEVSQWGD